MGVGYSDSTPGVTYAFDRRGRQTAITQGTTTTSRIYDDAGNLLIESYSGGPLDGLSVTNRYDQHLRRTNLAILNSQSSILAFTAYAYDNASRLATVSDGTNTATYTYLTDSPLVSQIEFAQSGIVRMTTTKTYDSLNRLLSISSAPSAFSAVNFDYSYNTANQRAAVTNADSSYWVYEYDALGQVVSGKKHWPDDTPVAGQQLEYAFDDIGNRKTAASGGDQSGANLRLQNYTANNLNQYSQRTVAGYVDVLGAANSNATVTLWSASGAHATAYRKGEYFRFFRKVPVWR